jgi:uncharacterized protein (DUF1501 family)
MKRSEFLKLTPAAAAAFILNGWPVTTFAEHPLLQLLAKQSQSNGRVLVLIQLTGGNDGLNTIIPLDQYSQLSAARSNILIPENKVLPIQPKETTGFHPAMGNIKEMYERGLVNIVQGVGYPEPNFSHFRSSDIWITGSDATEYLNTGWIGRFLDASYPGFPEGYPSEAMPDPLAIQIGNSLSTLVNGPDVGMGMALSGVDSFYNILNDNVDPTPATPGGHELKFLRFISQQTRQYTDVIKEAAGKAANLSTLYPKGNPLADQLKIVARLIAGGLQTPVYIVTLKGFDTHGGQTDASDATQGVHANLLKQLSEAVYAFFDDCKKLNTDDRIAAMTFSEFGRRITSNGSLGTDHGTTEPVMVFSTHVIPGMIGKNPVIPPDATVDDNLELQHDYRSIYTSILADWFQVPWEVLNGVMLRQYPILPIFRQDAGSNAPTTGELGQNYPNPFRETTTVNFNAPSGRASLAIYDHQGQLVKKVFDGDYVRGAHQVRFGREGLAAGIYFYELVCGKQKETRKMMVLD